MWSMMMALLAGHLTVSAHQDNAPLKPEEEHGNINRWHQRGPAHRD
jgi:hypothetical protein